MRFNPGWKMTLFVALLLPLMLRLGVWQLDRAEQKRIILESQQALLDAPPQRVSGQPLATYQPLTLIGEFEPKRHFLLDNVVHQGKVGFDVLTPFYDEAGQVVLLNRGWIAAMPLRENLPVINVPAGRQIVAANVARNVGKPFLLEQQVLGSQWPMVIQSVDLSVLAAALGQPLGDYYARLARGAAGGYDYHYAPVNVQPSKHTAYAVQWFAMATALLLLYILFGLGKLGTTSKGQ